MGSQTFLLSSVMRMFSVKHQHLILNHCPLTISVLQPSACHSKSVICEELWRTLPSLSLPTSKGERAFIIHYHASSWPRCILLLQTQNSSLACRDPTATGGGTSLLWKAHDSARFHWQILKPEQGIGWHSSCINVLWPSTCSLLHRCTL